MRHHRMLKKIKNPYRGLRGVYCREWRRLRADGPAKLLLFAIAPILVWFFCALYGNGTVYDLPVAVYDCDNSVLSRTMIRSIDATKLMRVIAQVNSIEELRNGIAAGDFVACFVFPEHMEADVKSSRQTHPQLYCNGVNYLAASYIMRDAQTVVRTMNAGLVKSRLTKSGLTAEQAIALVAPMVVDVSNLYNTTMQYGNFLSPGLIFAQLGVFVMLAGALCFARERERGTLGKLRFRARSGTLPAAHGKSLPYILIFSALSAMILFIVFPLYHIGSIPGSVRILPALALFLLASWWIGALIGMVAGRALVASSLTFGIGMPAFLFSGWTFPLPSAPIVYTWVSELLPFTHFMRLWFSAVEKGAGTFARVPDLLFLQTMALCTALATRVMLKFFWNRLPYEGAGHA